MPSNIMIMNMELKLTKDTFAFRIEENPFRKITTDSGIYLGDGANYSSEETGEIEQLNQIIKFGVVTIVGPDCKVVAVGDGIFFDARTPQPVLYYEAVWLLHEGSIRAYVKDDGTLSDLIKDKVEEAKAESFKTSLALKQPLGITSKVAGQEGSGLKLAQ